ncbi:MAG: glycogen-binding domain-containing protein [Balneolales bacterium]
MKQLLLFEIILTVLLLLSKQTSAQRIETGVALSASSGYVSNTYLVPMFTDWDRSRISAYSSITPSFNLQWAGSGRSLSVNTFGNALIFYNDPAAWSAGHFTSLFRQRLTPSLSIRAAGGVHYYSTSYIRNVQWLQTGLEWMVSPFVKFEIMAGPGRQSYSLSNDEEPVSSSYGSYGLAAEFWPGYRWRLKMNFYSSLSHLDRPGDGFSSTVSVSRITRNRTTVTLQTGLEQYSREFQVLPENGGGLSGSGDMTSVSGTGFPYASTEEVNPGDTIILEDRFHRTSLHVSYPAGNRITLTGMLAGLLWFHSEDNYAEPDYQVSIGAQVPFSLKRSRTGKIRSIRWETEASRYATLTLRYRDGQSLYLTGDFNGWEVPGIPLRQTGRNQYRVDLDLTTGTYDYKIAIRNDDQIEWLEWPDDTPVVRDGFGGENGRVFIDY